MGKFSQKDHRHWQTQKVHIEVLGSRYYSSQCKTQEHRTSKCFELIRKVGRHLLNERIRPINNTIELSTLQRDICIGQLASGLDDVAFRECQVFITEVWEVRHKSILECQKAVLPECYTKPQVACLNGGSGKDSGYMYTSYSGCSNHTPANNYTSTSTAVTPATAITTMSTLLTTPAPYQTKTEWIKNLSHKPHMEAQVSLLARGPNFSVTPLYSLKGEYVTAMEKACLKLPPNVAEEFRTESSRMLKCDYHLKCNITREDDRALKEKNFNRTSLGLYLQWTRGCLWWYLKSRTTSTKHRTYWHKGTLTDH